MLIQILLKFFSITYALSEELSDPTEVYKFNDEVCKLGLRGITFIVCSGDYGVSGLQCANPGGCGFHPMFPAVCPFVTAIGGTALVVNQTREISASLDAGSLITSGGGFSRIFSRPAWQNKAVKNYLKNFNLVDTELFGFRGRGYPDLALLSSKYEVILAKELAYISGTSATVPVFASLITLLNSHRLANGRPKLGFLNPLLYYFNNIAFNDVIEGSNKCCSIRENVCCKNGFTAAPGWDPVTGLGSIDYTRFLQFLDNI